MNFRVILILIFFMMSIFAEDIKQQENYDILELKLKEVHLNIVPSFKLVVPDASVKLGLKQNLMQKQSIITCIIK